MVLRTGLLLVEASAWVGALFFGTATDIRGFIGLVRAQPPSPIPKRALRGARDKGSPGSPAPGLLFAWRPHPLRGHLPSGPHSRHAARRLGIAATTTPRSASGLAPMRRCTSRPVLNAMRTKSPRDAPTSGLDSSPALGSGNPPRCRFPRAPLHRELTVEIGGQCQGQRMAVEGPARTALGDLRRHCSEQDGYVAVVYGDLRDESAGAKPPSGRQKTTQAERDRALRRWLRTWTARWRSASRQSRWGIRRRFRLVPRNLEGRRCSGREN